MKAPSGTLLFYVAMLVGGAAYTAVRLPTHAVELQGVSAALAACSLVVGVLLLVRFRWAPELFAALVLLVLGWGVVRGLTAGFTGTRIGLTASALVTLFAYPVLRSEVRPTRIADSSPTLDDGSFAP